MFLYSSRQMQPQQQQQPQQQKEEEMEIYRPDLIMMGGMRVTGSGMVRQLVIDFCGTHRS